MSLTKPVLTPNEVAEYLQLAPETVYRYIRQGKLVASRMGRHYRVERQEVERFLAARSTARPDHSVAESSPRYALGGLLAAVTDANRHAEVGAAPTSHGHDDEAGPQPDTGMKGPLRHESRLKPDAAHLELPHDVLNSARMTLDEIKVELAVHLYAQGRLSLGKARELAGFALWEFRQALASRRIPVHYEEADLQEDVETLRVLGRR